MYFEQIWGFNFIRKKALTQVFFCEFFEIFKNIFSIEYLPTATSETVTCNNLGNSSGGWKIFSPEWKTPYNINFFNSFDRVEIFSRSWKGGASKFLWISKPYFDLNYFFGNSITFKKTSGTFRGGSWRVAMWKSSSCAFLKL